MDGAASGGVSRGLRFTAIFLLSVLLALDLAWLAVTVWGWNWARPYVERRVEAATGRTVDIGGDLQVWISLHPWVAAERVRFGNARWGSQPLMLSADRLAFRFPLLPVFIGRFRLERLDLEGTRVLLERDRRGLGNWVLHPAARRLETAVGAGGDELELPGVTRVTDSALRYRDAGRAADVVVRFDALASRAGGDVLAAEARGRYAGRGFTAAAAIAGWREAGEEPSRVRAAARAGSTVGRAVGSVADLRGLQGIDVRLALRGRSLDELWTLLGLPLPESPPYRLTGRLRRRGDSFRLTGFDAALGQSDLRGDLTVRLRPSGRPRLDAVVRSRTLDLDDVEGFWGKPVREEESLPRPASRGPIFSDRPFSFAKLRAADARVDFRAARVQGRSLLDDVVLGLRLEDGRLELRPLALGMAGGRLTTRATIDARLPVVDLAAELVLRGLELERLLREMEIQQPAAGTLGGRADLRSRGNSLRRMAENLDGEVGVLLQEGRLGETALELLAIDLSEALVAELYGNQEAPIDCLIGVFDGEDGVFTARSLLMDSDDVRVTGEGTIDLAREQLDLTIRQHPKDFSVGTLRTPILIQGGFADRRARLERTGLARRAGGALALGALLHPAAALLALIEPGTGEEPGACARALAEYRRVAAEPPPPRQARRDDSP
jgi:uncharacterized protein involved in outer membrane biogenesis